MITGSYNLDTVEKVFDVALKINLNLTRLVNVKSRCFKCEGYWHYEDQYPSKIPSDDADNSKVLEDVHVPSKTTSIIEDV